MKIFNSRRTKIHRYALLATLAIASIITSPRAQQPAAATEQSSENRIALYQALLDLTNPWTVMCIAAHPDDEDGTSLIVMRRKYGAHTVSLFSTFGEGGQNAIGPELYEELGAIRARETMAAAEIQGSEPHFLGLKDFGYSKSADEAFRFWGHDEALRRMVLEIRKLRPDVIITNHSVTSNDHGHHQATARLVVEAFDAAADPKRFPEQLKDGVTTWHVQRLFVRARGAAVQNPDRQGGGSDFVTIDPNERDPIRGTMFAEQALAALQKHATQGPWPKTFAEFAARFRSFSGQNAAPSQLPLIRYVLAREAKGADALAKESRNFVEGLKLPEPIAKQAQPPTIDGKPLIEFIDDRERIFDALVAARNENGLGKEIKGYPTAPVGDSRLTRTFTSYNKALAATSGVVATMAVRDVLVPGESGSIEVTVSNRGTNPVGIGLAASGAGITRHAIELSAKHHVNSVLSPGATIKIPTTYKIPENAPLTVPHAAHLYDDGFAGTPVVAAVFLQVKGTKFPLVVGKLSDVAPPVEIEVKPNQLLIRRDYEQNGHPESQVTLQLVNHRNTAFQGYIEVKTNDGGDRLPVNLLPLGRESMRITAPRVLSNFNAQHVETNNWVNLTLVSEIGRASCRER